MAASNELLECYLEGPKQLRAAVAGMTREQSLARPVVGKWSTLEVVCHLADFEPIMADRMKRIIALDKPLLAGADENLFAQKLAYHERDLDEELTLIEMTRRQLGRVLNRLPAEAFQRVGLHNERGLISLESCLTLAANHVTHHVPFILEKRRALGLNTQSPTGESGRA